MDVMDGVPGIFIPLWLIWKAFQIAGGVACLWAAFRLGRWSAQPLPTFEAEEDATINRKVVAIRA